MPNLSLQKCYQSTNINNIIWNLETPKALFKGTSLTNLMEVSPSWENHFPFYKLMISKPSFHRNAFLIYSQILVSFFDIVN
jgi:hypothetical protein